MITVGDEAGEQLRALAGHLLVDALEPLDEAASVVGAVPVLPDLLDDLGDALAIAFGWLDRHASGLAEVFEERAVEAVEDQ